MNARRPLLSGSEEHWPCPDGWEWEKCPACDGRGETYGVECYSCGGMGGNCWPKETA